VKSSHSSDLTAASSGGSIGIWLAVAIGLSLLTLFFLIRSPQSQFDRGEPLVETSHSGMADANRTNEDLVYRPVERDGGRSVAVPKPSRTQRGSASPTTPRPEAELGAMTRITNLIDEGLWPEAEQLLIELLTKNPKNERALLEMAMIQLIEHKNPFIARDYLERALLINPDNETAVNELLVVYQETNNLEGGLNFLRSLADSQLERESGAVESGIGYALLQSGRAEESIEYFQQALTLSGSEDSFGKEQLASAFIEAGRLDEGVDLLRSVIANETDNLRLKNLQIKLAAAYINSQDREEALRILYDAQNIHPEDELISQIIRDLTTGRL